MRDVDGVVPLAFACLLLAYVESVSAARALAEAHSYEIDPRQELLGLGAANLAAALFQAYPVAGGLSQSSVNDKAGAKTPLALVFASLTIGLCLLFLTGLLKNLPNVVLAAIVLVAVKGLVNIGELKRRLAGQPLRVRRLDGRLRRGAAARHSQRRDRGGAGFAALLIRRVARPHVAFLGRIPGTREFSDMERNPDNEAVPGVLVGPRRAVLLYFNVEHVREAVREQVRSAPDQRSWWSSTSRPRPRSTWPAARMLTKLHQELGEAGIRLRLVEAHAGARHPPRRGTGGARRLLRPQDLGRRRHRRVPASRGCRAGEALDTRSAPDATRRLAPAPLSRGGG